MSRLSLTQNIAKDVRYEPCYLVTGGLTMNSIVDLNNPYEIHEKGIKALINALGTLGMVKFIQQYDRGEGDYTKERHTWLDGLSMEDFDRWLNRRRTETEERP
jgi:hypothetical protein